MWSFIPYTRIYQEGKAYPERVTKGVVFSIVNNESRTLRELNKATDVLREIIRTRAYLKLIARFQVLASFFAEEFLGLEHFHNVLCVWQRVCKDKLLLVTMALQSNDLLAPLVHAEVLELVNRQCVVQLMGQDKHRGHLWRLLIWGVPWFPLFVFVCLFPFLQPTLELLKHCNLHLHLLIVHCFDVRVPSNREILVLVEKPLNASLFRF